MPRFTHLPELLEAQPKAAPALRAPDRAALGYGDLCQVVEQTQRALNGWGIGRGDRVAMPRLFEWIAISHWRGQRACAAV